MTSYTVFFETAHASAVEEIEAATPQEALKQTHALYYNDPAALDWQGYDPNLEPLEAITIDSPTDSEKGWQSADLALRLAAPELLEALEAQNEAAQKRTNRPPTSSSPGSYLVGWILSFGGQIQKPHEYSAATLAVALLITRT